MITYNFEKYKVDANNKIEGIYWNVRDSDHSEENFQTGYYTGVTLEKELTPEEAIALIKSTLGEKEIISIEAEFQQQPFVIEKLRLEAQLRAETDGDGTIEE